MKALREIGFTKIFKFLLTVPLMGIFNVLGYPPLRIWFLKLFGSRIGGETIIHKIKFFNLYAGRLSNLSLGSKVFVGDDCLLDLADKIKIEDNVTVAERVLILTHMNVGYKDHPLQKYFPRFSASVELKKGCFIGANSTILPKVTIGEQSFIAAGSVVTKSIPNRVLAGGVPAKIIRKIK